MRKLISAVVALSLIASMSTTAFAKTSLGYEYGDVNSDGSINMKDALVLKKHIAEIDVPNYNREASDVNGDDTVNAEDLLALQKYLSKIDTATLGPEMTARIALFDGVSAVAEGDGTNVNFAQSEAFGTVITFSGNGVYYLSGKMTGRIVVKYAQKADEDKITIVLNGAEITCNGNSPFWVDKAEKTVIKTINKTNNVLTDNSASISGVKNACIYADDDLTINGKGTLTVNAPGKNGIKCENDLKITNGNLNITAGKNGLYGETSVSYKDAQSYIYADSDAIKTSDESSTDKGFVEILSGEIYAACGDDVLQATRRITVSQSAKIFYRFTASDISSCHKTKVGTTNASGQTVIEGVEDIAEGAFEEWTE